MPKSRLILSLAIASMTILPVGIANAGVDIQTDTVQMSLGGSRGVYIKTSPTSRTRSHRNRRYRANNTRRLNCYGVNRRSQNGNGGNQVYSSTSTTTCS
jgi:hypothetical protein